MKNIDKIRLPIKTKYKKVNGEPNIYKNNSYGTFRVKMTRKGTTFDKSFKTMEMAKNFRTMVYVDKVPIAEGRPSNTNDKMRVSALDNFEFSKRIFFAYNREESQIKLKVKIGKVEKVINMPKLKARELRAWLTSATQMQ